MNIYIKCKFVFQIRCCYPVVRCLRNVGASFWDRKNVQVMVNIFFLTSLMITMSHVFHIHLGGFFRSLYVLLVLPHTHPPYVLAY